MRIGLVGCGRVAERFHAPAFDASAAEIRAVYDPEPESLGWVVRRFPAVRIARDLDDLLGGGDLDAVAVCAPNRHHRPAVEAAVARGLAVLCEKPLGATLDDARGIAAAARTAQAPVTVNLCYRHHPLLAQLVATAEQHGGAQSWSVTLETPGLRLWRAR